MFFSLSQLSHSSQRLITQEGAGIDFLYFSPFIASLFPLCPFPITFIEQWRPQWEAGGGGEARGGWAADAIQLSLAS